MRISLTDKILITGGYGFLGSHLRQELKNRGYKNITRMRSKYCNLISQKQTNTYLNRHKPKVIIHLAGIVGGIKANKENPGTFFYENMQMGLNILEYARKHDVAKIIMIGTVCAYPKFTPVPFAETDLWNGFPEETNAPYGIAKRALMEMGRYYVEQYGMNVINLIPVNLYGPGDSFNPDNSHVIPALILKYWITKKLAKPTVNVWGDGTASREFLYVKDCARAIAMAMEKYDEPDPVNIGNGREITIKELSQIIANNVGFMGITKFDTTKPNGQPRRCLNTDKAKERFDFIAETSFEEGIKETIKWFERHADEITGSFRVQLSLQ